MNLADTLAIGAAGGTFLGGFLGLVFPFRDVRDLLDNAQRGAFVGVYFGSILGALVNVAGA